MSRKRVTEILPFLLPIRKLQRKVCFYQKMKYDHHYYASTFNNDTYNHLIFTYNEKVINEHSGHEIIYQYNKMDNLKLAASTINHLVIKPNETFSYWLSQKNNPNKSKMKEGLILTNDEITYGIGGGLCQLSNLLFWLALNSPLEIIERHHHTIEKVPNSLSTIDCCDATISEGWCDLKFKNNTQEDIEIIIEFDDTNIIGSLYSNTLQNIKYSAIEKNKSYILQENKTFIENDIYRIEKDLKTNNQKEYLIIHNKCEIGYPMGGEI